MDGSPQGCWLDVTLWLGDTALRQALCPTPSCARLDQAALLHYIPPCLSLPIKKEQAARLP